MATSASSEKLRTATQKLSQKSALRNDAAAGGLPMSRDINRFHEWEQ
jgi:hypothetical protein